MNIDIMMNIKFYNKSLKADHHASKQWKAVHCAGKQTSRQVHCCQMNTQLLYRYRQQMLNGTGRKLSAACTKARCVPSIAEYCLVRHLIPEHSVSSALQSIAWSLNTGTQCVPKDVLIKRWSQQRRLLARDVTRGILYCRTAIRFYISCILSQLFHLKKYQ